jgi:hypothetical protein
MARPASRTAKKKRTIEVDFSDVESGGGGGFHIPEGEYGVIVDSAEVGISSNDNEQIEWHFKGTDGKAKGKLFYFYTPLVEQALWKLRQTLEGLGVEVPDSVMDVDLDELEGLEGTAVVEDDEYQGKTRSKLAAIVVPEAEEPESRSAKSSAKGAGKGKVVKVSEDEVKEMSEDELESLIEKHDLGVDLSDYKILRKKIAAVTAALEENDLLDG